MLKRAIQSLQSVTEYFTERRKIKQNWAKPENSWYLLLYAFWQLLPKINFWREDWQEPVCPRNFEVFSFPNLLPLKKRGKLRMGGLSKKIIWGGGGGGGLFCTCFFTWKRFLDGLERNISNKSCWIGRWGMLQFSRKTQGVFMRTHIYIQTSIR